MSTMQVIDPQCLKPQSDMRAHVRRFVVDNFLFADDTASLSDDASFLESGIIDSTGVLELTQFIERCFGIQIADEELVPENLDSISNLMRFIESKCD